MTQGKTVCFTSSAAGGGRRRPVRVLRACKPKASPHSGIRCGHLPPNPASLRIPRGLSRALKRLRRSLFARRSGRRALYGLRCPHRRAPLGTGRHLCDRCPCSGSLFPPQAAVAFAAVLVFRACKPKARPHSGIRCGGLLLEHRNTIDATAFAHSQASCRLYFYSIGDRSSL